MSALTKFLGAMAIAAASFALAEGASAATVTVDFNDGITKNLGGGVKEYIEDGYRFYDARIVGGPCAGSGPDKCAALNPKEMTVLTRVDGKAFDLTSIWFYLNGKAEDGSNSFSIYETDNVSNIVSFTQPTYEHNQGYTAAVSFLNVFSITFESAFACPIETVKSTKVKECKDQGNARFDNVVLSTTPSEVPLPAAGLLLVGAVGALGVMRRRKAA